MAAVITRRAIRAALTRVGRRRPHPRQRLERDPMSTEITLNVNGEQIPLTVDEHASLLHTVRDQVGLTGSKEGCDDSECGACMMLLDGRPVNSCSYLAVQADGAEVTTVEGLSTGADLSPLQRAFLEKGGVQCGFCTPGMLVSATALLRANPAPTEDEIRIGLSGNLCRCTGYDGIVAAVAAAAREARQTPRRSAPWFCATEWLTATALST
ncbi:MAG: (2Fe-2S)-binding protein [Nocardioides sp.]